MRKWLFLVFYLFIFAFFALSKAQVLYFRGLPPTCGSKVLCFDGDTEYKTNVLYGSSTSQETIYYKEGSNTGYIELGFDNKEIYMQGSTITATLVTMTNSDFYLYAGTLDNPTTISLRNAGELRLQNTTLHLVRTDTSTDFYVDFSTVDRFTFNGPSTFSIEKGDISSLPTIDFSEYTSNKDDYIEIGAGNFDPSRINFSGWVRITDGINKLHFVNTKMLYFDNLSIVFDSLTTSSTPDFTMPAIEGVQGIYFINVEDLDFSFSFQNGVVFDDFYLKNSLVTVSNLGIAPDFVTKNLHIENSSLTLNADTSVLTLSENGSIEIFENDGSGASFDSTSLVEMNGGHFYMYSGSGKVEATFDSGIDFMGKGMNIKIDGSVVKENYDFVISGEDNILNSAGVFSISDSNMLLNGRGVTWELDGLDALNMQNTYVYINNEAKIYFSEISSDPKDGQVVISGSYLHFNDGGTFDIRNQTLSLSNSKIYADFDSLLKFSGSVIIAENSDIILQDGSVMEVGELNMTDGTLQSVEEGVKISASTMNLDGTGLYLNDDLEFQATDVSLNNIYINKVLSEMTSTTSAVVFKNLHLSGTMGIVIDIRTNDFSVLNGKYKIFSYENLDKSSDFQITFVSASVLISDKAYLDEDTKALYYDIGGFLDLEDLRNTYDDGTSRRESTFNFLQNVRDLKEDGLGEEGTIILVRTLLANSSDYDELDKSSHSLMTNTSNSFILLNSSAFDKVEAFEKAINHFDYRAATDVMLSYSTAKDTYWNGGYLTVGLASLLSKSSSFKYGVGGYFLSSIAEETDVWKEDIESAIVSLFGYQIQSNYQFGFAFSGMYSYVDGIKSDQVFQEFMNPSELADYAERRYEYTNFVTNLSFYYSMVSIPSGSPLAFRSTFQVSALFVPSVFYQEDGNVNVSNEVNTPDFKDISISYVLTPVQILNAGKFVVKYNLGVKYHVMNDTGGNSLLMFAKGYNNTGYVYYYDDIVAWEVNFDLKLQTNYGLSFGFALNKRGTYLNNSVYINYRIKGFGFY